MAAVLQDRNFDDLAHKFNKNIYGTLKGKLRLKILQRDFAPILSATEGQKLRILDAGGGNAFFSALLAEEGHGLVVCDISKNMLSLAKERLGKVAPRAKVEFIHSSLQSLSPENHGKFDVILLHAVLEWLADPEDALKQMMKLLKSNGAMSILVYNRHGMVMRSLMLGNLTKVRKNHLNGWKKSLTPINPQQPELIKSWLEAFNLTLLCHSGIRCFIDYVPKKVSHPMTEENIIKTEMMLSGQDPYRGIARYVHLLFQKSL